MYTYTSTTLLHIIIHLGCNNWLSYKRFTVFVDYFQNNRSKNLKIALLRWLYRFLLFEFPMVIVNQENNVNKSESVIGKHMP